VHALLIEPVFQRQQKSIDISPRCGERLFPVYTQGAQGGVGQNGQIRSCRIKVVRTLERPIDRHGGGNFADDTLKVTLPANPNRPENLGCLMARWIFFAL
jgi:hypothetical protein